VRADQALARALQPGKQVRIELVPGWGHIVELHDKATGDTKQVIGEKLDKALTELIAASQS
jgi:hypothetical protein